MSFFEPKPVFDFLTGTDNKNCMPWEARQRQNLTRHEWSAPHPLIFADTDRTTVEGLVRQHCNDPQYLILGIAPATCSIGPKGIETWTMTLIVQRALT